MPMGPDERARLGEATALACDWHADQHRKGTDVPYVSHLLQVAGLVLEHGGDVDQAIAGLLHDALEDAPDAGERARREATVLDRFGADVLDIVLACTDTEAHESRDRKGDWRARKTRYLSQLGEAGDRALLVAACDKLHNLGALVWELELQGPSSLERFNAGPDQQAWFFERLLATIEGRVPERLYRECEALERRFDALRPSPGSRGRAERPSPAAS